jgi:hypothetical protein
MALYNFHRILISTAILFAFGFGLYSYRLYGHSGATSDLAMAAGSAVVMAGMIAYLIYFNLKLQRHVTHGEYH